MNSFKDYVPAKFLPTYEHIVASLYAAFGDGKIISSFSSFINIYVSRSIQWQVFSFDSSCMAWFTVSIN